MTPAELKVLAFRVYARPAAQGSKSRNRYGAMYEASAHLPAWREAVKTAAWLTARRDHWQTIPRGVPVTLVVTFYLPRPKSHYRANGELKPGAPELPTSPPDLSKLVRGVEDALTIAGVWADDALVTQTIADKRYGDPGAEVQVMLS